MTTMLGWYMAFGAPYLQRLAFCLAALLTCW